MPWMSVTEVGLGETVINTDAIARFQKAYDGGTVIWLVDRTIVQVSDKMEEIIQALLKADEKKK